MTEPRAYTPEELREQMLAHIRVMCHYWATLPDKPPQERCEGVAFSILTMLDGMSGGVRFGCTLVAGAHPDDKQYHIAEGENWVEPGTEINSDCMLHELFYRAAAAMAG